MNRLEKSEISGLAFFNWKAIAAAAILIGVMLVLFWPTLLWMNERFFEENSYYGHGWLIPPAIAFLLYQRREMIIRNRPRPGWYGLVILIPGLLLHLFSLFFGIAFPFQTIQKACRSVYPFNIKSHSLILIQDRLEFVLP